MLLSALSQEPLAPSVPHRSTNMPPGPQEERKFLCAQRPQCERETTWSFIWKSEQLYRTRKVFTAVVGRQSPSGKSSASSPQTLRDHWFLFLSSRLLLRYRSIRHLHYHSAMSSVRTVTLIDSHTEGEPTRVVLEGAPDLGLGSVAQRLERFRAEFAGFRSGVVCEPRGSEVVVGALLLEPQGSTAVAGVIFFNDVGYLGMCGHGTIGVVTTLAHLGRISAGWHTLETPVGDVRACLHADGSVSVNNVASYRFRAGVRVDVAGHGTFRGDIAWGGNWFFLVDEPPCELSQVNRGQLVEIATAIRDALANQRITGADGQVIDHVEFFSTPSRVKNSARNFVLCPGASYDRSPCGTGTSAKMACLHADGKLAEGEVWRQEGILGTVFEGSITVGEDGRIHPTIRGRAWITGESKLLFAADDPFRDGIRR